jgi:hypothetical protein
MHEEDKEEEEEEKDATIKGKEGGARGLQAVLHTSAVRSSNIMHRM